MDAPQLIIRNSFLDVVYQDEEARLTRSKSWSCDLTYDPGPGIVSSAAGDNHEQEQDSKTSEPQGAAQEDPVDEICPHCGEVHRLAGQPRRDKCKMLKRWLEKIMKLEGEADRACAVEAFLQKGGAYACTLLQNMDSREAYAADGSHHGRSKECNTTRQGANFEVPPREICFLCRKDHSSHPRPPAHVRNSVKRMLSHAVTLPDGVQRASILRSLLRKQGAYACQLLSCHFEASELALIAHGCHGEDLPRPVGVLPATGKPVRSSLDDAPRPFTRALQTACIGLKDIMPKAELLVVREAREHKRLGGADSTGIATGEEIPVRVRDEIRYVYEEGPAYERAEAAIEDFNQIKMDTSAVTEEWWGPLMGESFAEMEENIEALMCRLRRMRGSLAGGGAATVLVGHSLMIRSIFHSFLLSGSTGASFHAASLRTKVVPCCGVVGARIIWDDRGEPIIKEAVPLLDTVLAAPDDKETHRGCVCGRAKIDPGCVIA